MRYVEVRGGLVPQDVLDYARENDELESANGEDILESIERSRAEMALEEEEQRRRRRVVASVEYDTQEVSAFGGASSTSGEAVPAREVKPPTKKQRGMMRHLGYTWDFIDSVKSTRQASTLIDKALRKRSEAGEDPDVVKQVVDRLKEMAS